jgi:hypothetical protein
MEEKMLQYGILGICVVAMGWYIILKDKHHEKRENEWQETVNKIADRMDKREEETNKTIRENTGILQGLKTLLENRK